MLSVFYQTCKLTRFQVWHKFHTPPWKNSDDPAVTEIDFSEDDGEALLVLLRIVHLQLNEIPNTIDLMTFYNIAVLCEQYDCLHIISPWVKKWSEELESADVTGVDCVPSRKIYIYWVIGNIPAFQKLAASLVKCCKLATHPGSISWQILPEGLYGVYFYFLYLRASRKHDCLTCRREHRSRSRPYHSKVTGLTIQRRRPLHSGLHEHERGCTNAM